MIPKKLKFWLITQSDLSVYDWWSLLYRGQQQWTTYSTSGQITIIVSKNPDLSQQNKNHNQTS